MILPFCLWHHGILNHSRSPCYFSSHSTGTGLSLESRAGSSGEEQKDRSRSFAAPSFSVAEWRRVRFVLDKCPCDMTSVCRDQPTKSRYVRLQATTLLRSSQTDL